MNGHYGVFRNKWPDTSFLAWDARTRDRPFVDELRSQADLARCAELANDGLSLQRRGWRAALARRLLRVAREVGDQ